jgi:HEAT repeat protein
MQRTVSVLLAATLLASACKAKAPAPGVPTLVDKMRSSDLAVRRQGIGDLIKRGDSAVPAIAALLSDPDSSIRYAAATTLWGMGVKARAAVPQLAAALRDSDDSVRAAAAMALGAIGPEASAAVPALVVSLKDQDRNVRLWAVRALGAIGPGAEQAAAALRGMVKDELLAAAIEESLRKIVPRVATGKGPGRH